jgi:hypothetical protein
VSKLRGNVFQRLAIRQNQAGECMPCVVNSAAPDFRLVAGLPENAITPVVHVDVVPVIVGNRLAILPDNLTRGEEDELGDFAFSAGEIFRLARPL